MAQNKKSFLLYCDIIHTISKLENEKAGILFKHILEYVNDLNPITNDIIIELVFEPIKQSLKRDLEKYENIINRNRLNGYKGGRPKNTNNPKNPLGYLVTQENPNKPKKADSDIDSDSDNVITINWRTDFNIYKDILFEHYTELLNDNKWIEKMERLNPNVNIQLTLEKCCVNYWATEAGWKKNKAKRTEPNFKMTLQNAVSNKINYVYKNRYE